MSGAFVVPVLDADLDGDVPWLATAFVSGAPLAEAVREHGPLPSGAVLRLAAGLADGLGAIHSAGVVHGSLNPSHVLLASDGPRLTDIGICRAAASSGLPDAGFGSPGFLSPGFLSPEQVLGQEAGPASDIFSLGAVLVFACHGHGPFGSGTSAALMYRLVNNAADVGDLPGELRQLVAGCLAKQPDARPAASRLLAELGGTQVVAGARGVFGARGVLGRGVHPGAGRGGRGAGVADVAPAGADVAPAGAAWRGPGRTWRGPGRMWRGRANVARAGADVARAGADVAEVSGALAEPWPDVTGAEPWPESGRGGRSRRRRRSWPSAPAWIAGGLLAASAAVIIILTGVLSPPAGQAQSHAAAVLAGPASTAQAPMIVSSSPAARSGSSPAGHVPSGHSGRVTPSVLQGPSSSSFLSPSVPPPMPPSSSAPVSRLRQRPRQRPRRRASRHRRRPPLRRQVGIAVALAVTE